jgi:hypothetical protein
MNKGKTKTAKWIFFSVILTLGLMPFLWLQQGCTGNYPPITAFVPPPFTPTFTPTPEIITFNGISSVPPGWSAALNSGTLTVPGLVLSTAQNQESSCSSSCNSLLTGPLVFSATGQSVNIEFDYPSNTDLTGRTISLYYYLDALPSNQPYGQMYVQDGGPGYAYGSLGFAGGTFALTAGAWTQASIQSTQSSVNPAQILKFGAQIGTGTGAGVNTFHTVNFYVDHVIIQ